MMSEKNVDRILAFGEDPHSRDPGFEADPQGPSEGISLGGFVEHIHRNHEASNSGEVRGCQLT